MAKLFLIDFSNFLYKYKNSLRLSSRLENGVQVNTSALYGIMKTLSHNDFDDVVICLDTYPALFKGYYPDYKGQRGYEFDEEVKIPIKELVEFCIAYEPFTGRRVQVACSPGCEADQVISSIVHGLEKPFLKSFVASKDFSKDSGLCQYQDWEKSPLKLKDSYNEIVVGTTDSDMYQFLQFPKVHISTRTNGTDYKKRLTPTAVMHCRPEQIPVYKALIGDVSDNIPCVVTNKSKKTINLILEALGSLDDLHKFITYLETNTGCQPGFKEVQAIITDIEQLKTNQKLSTLTFYNWPLSLQCKTADLNVILDKYKVKLR